VVIQRGKIEPYRVTNTQLHQVAAIQQALFYHLVDPEKIWADEGVEFDSKEVGLGAGRRCFGASSILPVF